MEIEEIDSYITFTEEANTFLLYQSDNNSFIDYVPLTESNLLGD